MARLEIITYPNPVLTTKGDDVDIITEDTRRFIDDLTETMYSANGVGLAANQVGDLRRICVIDTRKSDDLDDPADQGVLLQLVNPRIVHKEGRISWEEGCLSFPNLWESVERAARVRVEALNPQAEPISIEAEGLLSVVLQHEIDHLDGVVFLERMSRLKRMMASKRYRRSLENSQCEQG